jgi:hypothetical protein
MKRGSLIDVTETEVNFKCETNSTYSYDDNDVDNKSIDEMKNNDDLTVVINFKIESNRNTSDNIVLICNSLPSRTNVVLNIESESEVKYTYTGESFIQNKIDDSIKSLVDVNIINTKFIVNVAHDVVNPVLVNECNTIDRSKIKVIKSKKISDVTIKQKTINYINSNTYAYKHNKVKDTYAILCDNIMGVNLGKSKRKNKTYYSYGSLICGRVDTISHVVIDVCFDVEHNGRYVTGLICAVCKVIDTLKLKLRSVYVGNTLIFGLCAGRSTMISDISLVINGDIEFGKNSKSVGFITGYVENIRRNIGIDIKRSFSRTCSMGLIAGSSSNTSSLYDMHLVYQGKKRNELKCTVGKKRIVLEHIDEIIDSLDTTKNINVNTGGSVRFKVDDSSNGKAINDGNSKSKRKKKTNNTNNTNNTNITRGKQDSNKTVTSNDIDIVNTGNVVNDVYSILSSIRSSIGEGTKSTGSNIFDRIDKIGKYTKPTNVSRTSNTINTEGTNKTNNTIKTNDTGKIINSMLNSIEDNRRMEIDPKIARKKRRHLF